MQLESCESTGQCRHRQPERIEVVAHNIEGDSLATQPRNIWKRTLANTRTISRRVVVFVLGFVFRSTFMKKKRTTKVDADKDAKGFFTSSEQLFTMTTG